MRHLWQLPHAELVMGNATLKMEYVLIEYDGPQLAIFRNSRKQRYIGLAADAEGTVERWIHAPLSPLEVEGLCARGVPMRNVVCKDGMLVIDYENDRAKRQYDVSPNQIPSGILPVPGAYLPKSIAEVAYAALRISKPKPIQEPLFRLDGRQIVNHVIPFGGLAGVTKALQNLWSRIADVFVPFAFTDDAMMERQLATTLGMIAPFRGSFGIKVGVHNPEIFDVIAVHYKQLLTLPNQPSEADLGKIDKSILTAYSEYLKILEEHGIDVLTNWGPHEAAFISHGYARQVGPSVLAACAKPQRAKATEADPANPARGHFYGAALTGKRRFTFFDVQNDQTIEGTINSDLAKRLKETGGMRLGTKTLYNVKIKRSGNIAELVELLESQTPLFET